MMNNLKNITISGYSQKLLNQLTKKHTYLKNYLDQSDTYEHFAVLLSEHAMQILSESPVGVDYYKEQQTGKKFLIACVGRIWHLYAFWIILNTRIKLLKT